MSAKTFTHISNGFELIMFVYQKKLQLLLPILVNSKWSQNSTEN